ncbi:MAG: hypothetical protein HFI86_05855 [Bacilli bacterium]|nr:hypothetical protein [Bacilli bacterium]
MRKFKHIETGAILVPNNKDVIKQFEKSEYYEEVKTKAFNKSTEEKAIKDMNKKELVAYLKTLDIDADEDMKKDDLLALIPQE